MKRYKGRQMENKKRDHYKVERMNQSEVTFAIDWAAKEGWNPGLNDAKCFFETDPKGFFAGKLNGQIIAVGSAVIYDSEFAFCGFYIVDKSYRGQGFGLQLTKERLAYVGQRNAGIDGVLNMLDKYERLGYRLAHNNARYQCMHSLPSPAKNEHIMPLRHIDFNTLLAFDRRFFPAARPKFLQCWINQPGALSLAYFKDGELLGYGVIRPCLQGFKVGPLFAEHPSIAQELFLNLALHAPKQAIYLDIPESNLHAVQLVEQYGLEKVFATARMYLKGQPNIKIEGIYGITSFELG
jgi:GNAT superfamily N-acetyltransferase